MILAAVTFVENPASVIYIPPKGAGDLVAVCVTQNPARISIRSANGASYKPGDSALNITQVTDRKIVLYVRSNDTQAINILDRRNGPFRCQAQDQTTSQISLTDPFEFVDGGKCIDSLVMEIRLMF